QTCHPGHDPNRNNNSNMVPIVECANIEGGEPDPALPLTLSTRAYMPTEQMLDLARQRGLMPD
ncbi:hypothetical protein, partial [Mycobacterium avium]|uniref:hypothetical protein n=1 Tax=Mycobacterium avium TaxID=1764 RepID=UPI001CC7A6C7